MSNPLTRSCLYKIINNNTIDLPENHLITTTYYTAITVCGYTVFSVGNGLKHTHTHSSTRYNLSGQGLNRTKTQVEVVFVFYCLCMRART